MQLNRRSARARANRLRIREPVPIALHALRASRRSRLACAFVSCAVAGACASAGPMHPGIVAPERLAETIDSVVSTPPLNRTHWGLAVLDAESGEWLVRYNAERHFIPASVTKLVVTSTALAELGPDYRYETPVFVKATGSDTVAAELLIIGRGDPSFSERFRATDFTVIDSIADLVAAAGIRRVGDIVTDVSFFGDERIHYTWEIGDLPESYAPPIDAFAIGEGTFQLVVEAGASTGQPAKASANPTGLQLVAGQVITDTAQAPTRIRIDFMERTDSVIVSGSVAKGAVRITRAAVTDPALYATRALQHALRSRGIHVDGRIRFVRDSLQAQALRNQLHKEYLRIATIPSPPLIDIVAAILRPSQNWIAEQLLKTLGGERRGSGGWDTGLDVERRFLIDTVGLDSTTFFLRDGSGLSAQNLLAPEAVVQLLAWARRQPWGAAWYEALPEPGMETSTLQTRLLPLRGRLRAKTGSITNVNTLSGYLTTTDGRQLIFSLMTNGTGIPAGEVRRGMDRIIEALASEGAQR